MTELELFSDSLSIDSVHLEEKFFGDFLDRRFRQNQRVVLQHRVDVETVNGHDVDVGDFIGGEGDVLWDDVVAKKELRSEKFQETSEKNSLIDDQHRRTPIALLDQTLDVVLVIAGD